MAQLDWRESGEGEAVLAVAGHCTMAHLPDLLPRIDALRRAPTRIDLSGLETLDSAGALVLLRLLDRQRRYGEALGRIAAALKTQGMIDTVIPEPRGGAHRHPRIAAREIGAALLARLDTLRHVEGVWLRARRRDRLAAFGRVIVAG